MLPHCEHLTFGQRVEIAHGESLKSIKPSFPVK